MRIKLMKEKRYFCYKHWIVFPFAAIWSRAYEFALPAWQLSIHFLCWHWRWTFVKENNNG